MDYRSILIQNIINSGNIENSLNRIIQMQKGERGKSLNIKFVEESTVTTPSHIVDEMLNALPTDIWNHKTRFLNIACKDGIFLVKIFQRLMEVDKEQFKDDTAHAWHILENQLYAICVDETIGRMLSTLFYGMSGLSDSHVTWFNTLKDLQKLSGDALRQYVYSRFRATGQIEKSEVNKYMQFDVIIGNPPYNNDIYLDFVQLGHKLSTGYTMMITPAKWQAKGGTKNEQFRKEIVPYMSEIKYYEKPTDVFPNTAMCGDAISYYLISKEKANNITINGKTYVDWKTRYGLDNNCINIVKKIQGKRIVESGIKEITPCKSYFTTKNFGDVNLDMSSRYYMRSSARCIKVPEWAFKNTVDMDKYKVYIGHFITNNPVIHIVNPYVADVREDCLLGFGTKEFCESIKSYYQCRLIWYLVYMTNCGNASAEAFVNVPQPEAFDHIFTDQEIYEKYNLTEKEINIIESVIKKRK